MADFWLVFLQKIYKQLKGELPIMAMNYEEFKQNIKGIFIATMAPFTPDNKLDEDGIRKNINFFGR
jgi:hypothetical protein